MVAGLSREEVLHEVLFAPRAAFVPVDDTRIIERPGWWQIVTPSFARGGMNEVACTELPEADADRVIDETIESYARLGLRFRWKVGPNVKPADLAERLARRGLKRSEGLAMARATTGALPDTDPSLSVEEVGRATLDDFNRVMAEGWQIDVAPFAALHGRMLADPARRNHLFLARIDGTPAATATYAACGRSAFLVGGMVLPVFRGRGLYRALVNARLRHAAARGLPLATTHALVETSAPILSHLGFEIVCPVVGFSSW